MNFEPGLNIDVSLYWNFELQRRLPWCYQYISVLSNTFSLKQFWQLLF